MKSRSLRPRTLAVAVAALVAASGLSADRSFAGSPVYVDDAATQVKGNPVGLSATQASARYIVRFVEQPLAQYNSVVSSKPVNGIGAIPLKVMKNGRSRLDVHSSQATSYVQYLKTQQQQHVSDINAALHASVPVRYSMQHALNAIVTELTPAQVAAVQKVPGVIAVERDRPHAPATDIGPGFIGAASIWWGASAGQDTIFASSFDAASGFLGDGMVVGDIDTGYNSSSPSFAVTDQHGYTITNPLGTGNFIGQCNVPGISDAGCNDKVIGVYDEIDLTGGGPPFSVEDTQGHGSHTASTAAGDFRSATLSGYTANIAGVAPHANLVIYYACSPDPNVQCSTAATSASVDQAIQDGIVDALNYSISGGQSPWNDSTSLAFLSATDAGIFVAAAAGNTSASVPNQVPGTANHAEPWVTTVAASTHTGGSIAPTLTITGPGSVPANLQGIPLTAGAGGVSASASFTGPIVLSPQFHNSDLTGSDGCAGYPAGTFTGAAALVSRGTCSFSIKVNNATAAGAVAVIISDNRVEGPLTPSVPGTTVPAYTVLQSQGTNLQTFLAANSNTGAAFIPYPPSRLPQQPDELAGFSLLGPVSIDVIKPDVEAPGVNILAAVANAGDPNVVALFNGTSMATPHTTGSAALLMGLHPEWSPEEAKSAMMMTAKEVGLTKANGTTPADFFDRGSGRLQDFVASKTGLVMNETGLNFANADPGFGGNPSSLNLASMDSSSCIGSCSFTRKFHSTQSKTVTWTATTAAGSDPGVAITVTPSSFPATANHDTAPVTFDVDSSALTSDGAFHFAEVVLTPDDPTLVPLHLTLAIAVPPPTIAAAPNPLSITGVGAGTASSQLTVFNIGGPTLNVTQSTSGSTPFVWADQVSGDSFGYGSVQYTGLGAGDTDFFASDDFNITGNAPVDLSLIYAPGFVSAATLSSFGPTLPIHVRIYSDAGGKPSSDPDTGGPAVYSLDTTAGAPGVSVVGKFGGDITIDLATLGEHTALPAGHYWLLVYPTMPCNDVGAGCSDTWFWLNSNTGNGAPPVVTAPQAAQPWSGIDPAAGGGFAMHLESAASCTPPSWLGATGFPLAIAGNDSAQLTVSATGPFPGGVPSVTGYLCLASNDAVTPILPVQVNASGGAHVPPTVSKAFSPNAVITGANSTATITLTNGDVAAATLSADLVDTLPANLVATAGTAATTCAGGAGASIAGGGGSVTLGNGAVIPGSGSCTVTFTVTTATAATYTNTIGVGAVQTNHGNNTSAASADLTVSTVVNEGFDDITTLAGKGWILANHSAPLGSTNWFQGTPTTASPNPGPFDAQAGAALNSYIAANFNNTSQTGSNNTISNWMLSPPLGFNSATSFSFWTRTTNTATFPDRLEVRLCTNAPCTNFGSTATDFGDFGTVLLSINPNLLSGGDQTGVNGYPTAWAQFVLTNANGIPTSGTGRIAFRYYVTSGGFNGANSDYIGIDTVSMQAGSVNSAPAGISGANGISAANSTANNKRTQ